LRSTSSSADALDERSVRSYAFDMVIELTSDDQIRLSAMAANTQRSESEIAREAMHWFLSDTEPHSGLIAQARTAVAEGRVVDHEVLFQQLDRLIDEQ
jgi:predicted transcriptional regulator